MNEISGELREKVIRAINIVRVMAIDTGTVGQMVNLDPAVSYMYCDKCAIPNNSGDDLLKVAMDSGYDSEDMRVYNGVLLIGGCKPSVVLSDGTELGALVSVTDNDCVRHSVAIQDGRAYLIEGNIESFLEMCVEVTQAW